MPFVSVTRLRLRSWRFFPQFLWYTIASARQAQRAEGFLSGKLAGDSHLTFWTLTSWSDDRAMRQYRGAATHGRAMRKLPEWCDEAATANWSAETAQLPTIEEAYEQLMAHGRPSRVNHPTPDHINRRIPAPKVGRGTKDLQPIGRAAAANNRN